MDFTYEGYGGLLRRLKEAGYGWGLFDGAPAGKRVYLRHDMDLYTDGAVPMAQAESDEGFVSTWFFLSSSAAYNLLERHTMGIMQRLAEMGHRLALHVDATFYADNDAMFEDIVRRYDYFSAYFPLERVVSYHKPTPAAIAGGAPAGFACTYDEAYFKDMMYISDANHRRFWLEPRLDEAVERKMPIQLLTHPLWWHRQDMELELLLERFAQWQEGIAREYLGETFKVFDALLKEQGFEGRQLP